MDKQTTKTVDVGSTEETIMLANPASAGPQQAGDESTSSDVPEMINHPLVEATGAGSNAGDTWQKPRRKNRSGAEIRKRRRARKAEAEAKASTSHPPPTTIQKTEKRPRSEGSSGPSPGNRKRAKTNPAKDKVKSTPKGPPNKPGDPKRSYKQAASSHLRVALIDPANPLGKISEEVAGKVRVGLWSSLDQHIQSGGETTPLFSGMQLSGEILRITCDDEATLKWLKTTVSASSERWCGKTLVTVGVDQLPTLTKATLWIPGKPEEPEVVLRRLGFQNKEVGVPRWCTFLTKPQEKPEGLLLIMGVDKAGAEAIEKKGMKLKYMFGDIPVRMRKGNTSSGGPTDDPMEVEANQGSSTNPEAATGTATTQ